MILSGAGVPEKIFLAGAIRRILWVKKLLQGRKTHLMCKGQTQDGCTSTPALFVFAKAGGGLWTVTKNNRERWYKKWH
jgi:hypothetical protein